MQKSMAGAQGMAICTLLLCGLGNVQAQDVNVTDITQYKSMGIDASVYDDKLIDNKVMVALPDSTIINSFICYGARSDKNDDNYDLHGNTVDIKSGSFNRVSIFGGYSDYRYVNHNQVLIEAGSFIRDNYGINGGYSLRGTVYANQVLINGGTFNGLDIVGGYSEYGSISKNSVIITDGNFQNYVDVYGGKSEQIGIVSDNSVQIDSVAAGSQFSGIYGGESVAGLVSGNTARVSADINAFELMGGYGAHNTLVAVYGNSVYLTDSNSMIYTLAGGKNTSGLTNNNQVWISGSTLSGSVYGGLAQNGSAADNSVSITGSSIGKDDFGEGAVYGASSSGQSVSGNQVRLLDSTAVVPVYGGYTGGTSDSAAAVNNMMILDGSSVTGDVYGGYAAGTADSTGNTVELIDSTVTGSVYGGYSQGAAAAGNTIVLYGRQDAAQDLSATNLICGFSGSGALSDNRLILNNWSGSLQSLSGCNEIIFADLDWQNGGTALTLTGGSATDLSQTTVNGQWISFGFDDPRKHVGEKMQLVQNTSGITFNTAYDEAVQVNFLEGIAYQVYGDVTNNRENNSIDFTIRGSRQNEQLKLMTYNRNIGMALVNQGSDLLEGALWQQPYSEGSRTFAAMQGNFSRYNVGGAAKLNGWSGMVGIGSATEAADGKLTYGIFYENGSGNYRDYNTFNDNYFRFDGAAVYNGGGLATGYTFDNGLYAQAALRAGMLKNELKNGLYDRMNQSYGYLAQTAYYGGDVRIGKLFNISDAAKMDVYGGFYYMHFGDADFTISGSAFSRDFQFGDANSKRLRIGGRIIRTMNDRLRFYYGAAGEYEFDGRANVAVEDEFVDDDNGLHGATLIGEAGVSYADPQSSPWSVALKLCGYGGKREGFSADLLASCSF